MKSNPARWSRSTSPAFFLALSRTVSPLFSILSAEYLTGISIPVDGGRMNAVPRHGGIGPVIKAMKEELGRYDKSDWSEQDIADMDVGLVDMDTDKKVIDPV